MLSKSMFAILGLTLIFSYTSASQEYWPRLLVQLRISAGSSFFYDTLGCDPLATYCIDSIDTNLIEEELPFAIPVFGARFTDHRSPSCLGTGTRLHIQDFGLDTFRLRITPPDSPSFPIEVSWSFYESGLAYWQSLIIGGSGSPITSYVNMRLDTVLIVDHVSLTTLDIIGASAIDPVEEEDAQLPARYALYQNYPNPFNSTTTISYHVPFRTFVDLSVYDLLGTRVRVLSRGEQRSGSHSVQFDAATLPSGIYITRLSSARFQSSMKLIHLK